MDPGLLHAGVSQDEGSPGSENDGSLPDPWHLGHGASPRLCMEMLTRSSVLARDIPWTGGARRGTVHGFAESDVSEQPNNNRKQLVASQRRQLDNVLRESTYHGGQSGWC